MRVGVPVLVVLFCAACAPSSADVGDRAAIEAGWRTYSRGGVSIGVPAGWTAEADGASGRLDLRGPAGRDAAFVWPLHLPGTETATRAGAVLRTLSERAWPDTDWDEAAQSTAGGLVIRGEQDDEIATALFAWTASPAGVSGVIYAVRSPRGGYPAAARLASKMFATFRLRGGSAAAGPARAAARTRTRFTDPREGAFSVEVPQGWAVEGGVFRHGAVDVRLAVEARSPDGGITVRLGDPSIGTFVTGAIGHGEGSVFSPGFGQMMTVRRYIAPAAFAAEYAGQRPDCPGFKPVLVRARPDITATMNGLYKQYGLAVRLDGGEVSFSCGDRRSGYWLAVLQIVQMGGPAMWKPEYLVGYTAPAGREAEARAAFSDLIGTIQVDPAWYQRQTGMAAQVSRVVTETGEAIARAANGGYWDRKRNERATSVGQSNATLGIEQVENPETGARHDVAAGSNHYWVSADGRIVGTETDAVPHVDFAPLSIVPPGR